jgi:hypothetical protein
MCEKVNQDSRKGREETMNKKSQRISTKEKQLRGAYVMPRRDKDLWIAACYRVGESRSEFLRTAIRERALKILSSADQQAT